MSAEPSWDSPEVRAQMVALRQAFEPHWEATVAAAPEPRVDDPHDPTPGAEVAVITAVYGDYDDPAPLPRQDIACDAILVSDRPYDVPGWRNVVRPAGGRSPRLAAKVLRCRPDLVTEAATVVWLDGHVRVRSAGLIRELVEQLGEAPLGVFAHGFFRAITQEAALAATLPKYEGYDLFDQVRHYLATGHPDDWGLWTTGIMVRRPAETREFGDAWQAEIDRWGPEDQISLPFALRRTIGRPAVLPFEGWWEGSRFTLGKHNDGTGLA